MKRGVEMFHFKSPIERNSFVETKLNDKKVKNIKIGHDDMTDSYWVRYETEEVFQCGLQSAT